MSSAVMTRRAFDTRGNLADQLFRCLETPYSDVLEHHTGVLAAVSDPSDRKWVVKLLPEFLPKPTRVLVDYALQDERRSWRWIGPCFRSRRWSAVVDPRTSFTQNGFDDHPEPDFCESRACLF